MLVVFYCNSKACRNIHIRADGRKRNEHAVCPKCGGNLEFICDFHSWTGFGINERKESGAGQMLILRQEELYRDLNDRVYISQIQNSGLYYEVKQMIFEQEKLREENNKLKITANDYHENYIRWREIGIRYHDELWSLLCDFEPEKYQGFYDYAAGVK